MPRFFCGHASPAGVGTQRGRWGENYLSSAVHKLDPNAHDEAMGAVGVGQVDTGDEVHLGVGQALGRRLLVLLPGRVRLA